MADYKDSENQHTELFNKQIRRKVRRKTKLTRQPEPPIWSSFSLFGVVGWSVAIPTLLAIGVGIWLDRSIHDNHSWTLVMLPVGLAVGCGLAWHWVRHEQRQIEKHEQEDEE